MKELMRTGAYGVIVREGKILLVRQVVGPYVNLWHLPGGGIEFAETPLQALDRELLEEVAIQTKDPLFLTILSDHGEHKSSSGPYRYHYLGIIYRLPHIFPLPQVPEDESKWFPIASLSLFETTPFVRQLYISQLF